MKNKEQNLVAMLRYAFIKSLPVLCGYVFLGIAFGIVLEEAGFSALWALLISVTVFAGSLQFVMVPLLAAAVSPLTMAATAFFVNSRHLFYGLSFIESYKKMKTRPYMIFSLTDETYSVLCGCRAEDPDETMRPAWFFISLFDQCYWITGSVIGGLLGHALPLDFTGIDFSMTALFVVILLEQMLTGGVRARIVGCAGLVVAFISLMILGTGRFLLPALIVTALFVYMYGQRSVVMDTTDTLDTLDASKKGGAPDEH